MEKRNINIDIIKVCAVFFVISVHFFLNNNFYTTEINCPRMYIMGIMRTFFMMCVPLFLLITGYLMNKKEFSLNFYKSGLKKIIYPYIIISIITLLAKLLLIKYGIFPAQKIGAYFTGFIDFNLVDYGWYVDLYIGLFLLIPYINRIFTNSKQDLILVIVLVILTAMPSLCKCPTFFIASWQGLWPLTYYVIGAYISRYEKNICLSPPPLCLKQLIFLFIGFFILFSTINILFVKGHLWNLHKFDSWGSVENMFHSVLFFLIFLKLNFNKIPQKIKNIISEIAKLSLGIYLSSYLVDSIVYKYFNQYITNTTDKLEYFVIIVPFVFICSIIMAKISYKIIKN